MPRLRHTAIIALFFALLTAWGPALAAEDQLVITVIDGASGRAVPRAEVIILGQPGVRLTDEDGKVVWRPVPAPPFEVLVVLPGGRYVRPELVRELDTSGAITIRTAAVLSEDVTVAAGASPSISSTPGSATALVTGAELGVRMPANLTQALDGVAGVSSVSEGHAAVPAVRGFSAGRTLILLDGARVTSERRVGPSATFLDPFALESVEVARGPGSVAYGSDAFGGVIYARTRRVALNAPLGVRFVAAGGVGIPEVRSGVEVARGFGRSSVLVQAHGRGIGDYRSPEGRVLNSSTKDRGLLVRGEHVVGPGVFSAAWQGDFGRDVERPRNNSATVRFYYPQEDSNRFTFGYDVAQVGGFERISTTAFLGSHRIVTDQDRVATATTGRSIERADVSARDFHVRVNARRNVGLANVEFGTDINGRFGLEAFEDRIAYATSGELDTHTRTAAVEDARRTDAALFASALVPAGRYLQIGAGLRGDRVTTRNTGGFFGDRSTASNAASGYLSATAGSFRGFTFTGQVARGFRDPLLSDRYYRGPTGRGFITGNPDLSPETSLQFDGGVRYTAGRYRAAVSAFNYRITDLIERYQTTTDNFFFRNRGRARMRGVEIELQADLGAGFALQSSAQFTRGRTLDDDTALDGVPPASFMAQLRRALGTRGFAQIRLSTYARDENPGPTERVTPGYALVDLSGGWELTPTLELRGLARNVFDQPYLLSPDSRTVPAPGASLMVTLIASLGR